MREVSPHSLPTLQSDAGEREESYPVIHYLPQGLIVSFSLL
jgi:hypothetical protein